MVANRLENGRGNSVAGSIPVLSAKLMEVDDHWVIRSLLN